MSREAQRVWARVHMCERRRENEPEGVRGALASMLKEFGLFFPGNSSVWKFSELVLAR